MYGFSKLIYRFNSRLLVDDVGVNVTLGTLTMSISVKYELQMKRKEGEDVPKKRVGRKKTKQDTSEDEEDCAAFSCLRPSGKIIDFC